MAQSDYKQFCYGLCCKHFIHDVYVTEYLKRFYDKLGLTVFSLLMFIYCLYLSECVCFKAIETVDRVCNTVDIYVH